MSEENLELDNSNFLSDLSDNGDQKTFFPDSDCFSLVKVLGKEAKFPVFLVRNNQTNQLQAIKLFPCDEKDEPSIFFKRETRFSKFQHPNIISFTDSKSKQEFSSEFCPVVSYIVMEYAKYGDLFEALITYRIPFHETITRTYFHHLFDGLEFLHSQGAAHLDLKLENLLLDSNYILKIADFDLSYLAEDKTISTKGTAHFRAPEILEGNCKDPQAADIYSAGIILFIMKTGGLIPFRETGELKGIQMRDLKDYSPHLFWEKHCELLGKKPTFFSEDFRSLFLWMTQSSPEKRPTAKQVKSSRWYRDEICTDQELFMFMNGRFGFL